MPVTTRSQAARKVKTPPTESPPNSEDILAPRSLNESLPDISSLCIKPSTASKVPISHPLPRSDSNHTDEDSRKSTPTDATKNTFKKLPFPENDPISTTSTANSLPVATDTIHTAPQPPLPTEKLLKPLPDKPIECTKLPDGPEPVTIEVDYPATEDLQPFDDHSTLLAILTDTLRGMQSPEWSEACLALLDIRRIARYHPTLLAPELDVAVPAIIKSARSLRSALSKTAIMASRDLYLSLSSEMLPYTDVGGMAQPLQSLLGQLLLKAASNDKKFVIEEAQRTLSTMAEQLKPSLFLPLILPYTEHKNPKVRGKAASILAASVTKLSPMQAVDLGLDVLLRAASRLLSDNTPEARDAAKKLIMLVKNTVEDDGACDALKAAGVALDGIGEGESLPSVWEGFCTKTLGASKSVPVLRASSS